MASWRVPPCSAAMLEEANRLWPGRSRALDGTIGDAAHRKRRSDHNPDERGVVLARDLTHDPRAGADMETCTAGVVARKDRRIRYVIWNGRIWRSYQSSASHPPPWTPEPYRGTNRHDKHAHFSFDRRYEADASPFWPELQEEEDVKISDEDLARIVDAAELGARRALHEVLDRLERTAGDGPRTPRSYGKSWADVIVEAWKYARRAAGARLPD